MIRINISVLERLQKSPIDILLLFSLEQVNNAVWRETSMTSTGHADDSSYITSLRRQQRLFNDTKLVFARCSLDEDQLSGLIFQWAGITVCRSIAVLMKSSYSFLFGIMPAPSHNQNSSSDPFWRTWSALKLPSATNTLLYTHLRCASVKQVDAEIILFNTYLDHPSNHPEY